MCSGRKWHAEDLKDTWDAGRLQKWKAKVAMTGDGRAAYAQGRMNSEQ